MPNLLKTDYSSNFTGTQTRCNVLSEHTGERKGKVNSANPDFDYDSGKNEEGELKMQIKNRFTGEVILEIETLSGADLSGADLREANLSRADLYRANLSGANLSGADLRVANLSWADLSKANLREADLREANLSGANLSRADLYRANLSGADLRGADLREADLRGADLSGTDLREANLSKADLYRVMLPAFGGPQGTMKGYKKASGKVVELIIPHNAKRTYSLVGRKCRAEFAYIKNILNPDGTPSDVNEVLGTYDSSTIYKKGCRVDPDKYCDDIRIECSHGIHFFITFEEARDY